MAKILVINEHGENRYILPAALESLGHRVTIVTGSSRVMIVYRDEKPDLVIAVEHPHSPAFAYLERLANDGMSVPVIVLVSDSNPQQTPARIKAYQEHGFIALSARELEREESALQQALHLNHEPLKRLIDQELQGTAK